MGLPMQDVRTVTGPANTICKYVRRDGAIHLSSLDEFILPQLLTPSICWDLRPLSVQDALSRAELSHGLPPKRISILSTHWLVYV